MYTAPTGATTATPGAIIKSATWNSIFVDISSALTLLGQQLYNSTNIVIGQSPYAPVATDTTLLLTTSGGAITINLPTATSRNGYPLFIKDNTGNAATNKITITPNGADTIEGLATLTIPNNYGEVQLIPNDTGNGWVIQSSNVQNFYGFSAVIAGTTAPTAAAGNTGIAGTLAAAPSLAANGQALLYNETVNGAVVQGQGSTNDVVILNKSGSIAARIPTGTQAITTAGLLANGTTTGVGYTTGAGTAVTQLTNRTTAVTSNTLAGSITLFTTTASATAASFTVNNTAVLIDDTIIISVHGANAGNFYHAFVTSITASTSFQITFYSITGTNSDTPVFNYTIMRGAHN